MALIALSVIGPSTWTNLIAAGPIVTTQIAGKMQNTSGNTIFTPVFAAASSARCRRLVRSVSECTRSDCATLVPNLSVCTSIATSDDDVVDAGAVGRGCAAPRTRALPARSSRLISRSSSAQIGVREGQLLADALNRLVEAEAGLDADDQQVERVGQAETDAVLPALRHAARAPCPAARSRRRRPPSAIDEVRRDRGAASRSSANAQQRDADADAEEDDERFAAAVAGVDQPLLQLAHLRRRPRRHAAEPLQRIDDGLAPYVGFVGLGRRHAGHFAEAPLDRAGAARRQRHRRRPRPAAMRTGTRAAAAAASRYTSILMTLRIQKNPIVCMTIAPIEHHLAHALGEQQLHVLGVDERQRDRRAPPAAPAARSR